eukprot:gnl/TRDRNA2_/TRDRNA2_32010_c0_seq1.p1 gnl/TRDRNA2_/TRDRNA2_32010_c0~~gnl/TRDRNA2_/TRDRNA2_32010_c0_seq1.p1  ORF type:complete len:107 (-),score=21.05 gnl/TRDRNA2_/TRDRNA2_32010_c0_seq1:172-492(-)
MAHAVISRGVNIKQNTVWEHVGGGAKESHMALEVSWRSKEASRHGCKAALLAPSVPLVNQHLEMARKCHQPLDVDKSVDAWSIIEWIDVAWKNDALITTLHFSGCP